ncbi:MAG TPA: hypothetical protein VHX20_03725, partial [Terracidiphilus sp.]|nr:hypothetical protein [Terracidiphilus sp.]
GVRENTTASKKRPTPRENKAERQTSKCKNTICGLYVPRSYGILQEAHWSRNCQVALYVTSANIESFHVKEKRYGYQESR